jgi:topoisomerase-4 subunit A
MKRFQLEEGDKTQFFLDEGAPMRFVAMTDRSGAKLEVVFGGQHQQRPTEMVEVDEFIGIKSHRAKGKRITTYEVATLRFIEPEEPEPEELDEEMDDALADTDVDGDTIDVDELMGDDIKADPNVDYTSRGEREDGSLVAQLDLF